MFIADPKEIKLRSLCSVSKRNTLPLTLLFLNFSISSSVRENLFCLDFRKFLTSSTLQLSTVSNEGLAVVVLVDISIWKKIYWESMMYNFRKKKKNLGVYVRIYCRTNQSVIILIFFHILHLWLKIQSPKCERNFINNFSDTVRSYEAKNGRDCKRNNMMLSKREGVLGS